MMIVGTGGAVVLKFAFFYFLSYCSVFTQVNWAIVLGLKPSPLIF